MKFKTIEQAMKKGFFRDGDIVDLTNIIHPDRVRLFCLPSDDTGVMRTQNITSKSLKWFYCWNSNLSKPVLVGLPSKDCEVAFDGQTGFINKSRVIDNTVNNLYANNAIGIFGRQITELDFYGLIKKEFDEETPFEKMMNEVSDIEKIFTGTPFVKSFFGPKSNNKFINYGFKKITFNPLKFSEADADECLISTMFFFRKGARYYDQEEKLITTPLFPILYGNIDELLVDVSDLSQQKSAWKLYPPTNKPIKC